MRCCNLPPISKPPHSPLSQFSSHALIYSANQTEPAKGSMHSSSNFLFTASARGIFLAGHLPGKVFSRLHGCEFLKEPQHKLSCIIHSFSNITFSCSGLHGAEGLSHHAMGGRKSTETLALRFTFTPTTLNSHYLAYVV